MVGWEGGYISGKIGFKRKMEFASVPSIFPFVLFQERRSRKQSPSSRHSWVKKLGRGPRHSLRDDKKSSIEARAWAALRLHKRSWEPSAYIYTVRRIILASRFTEIVELVKWAYVIYALVTGTAVERDSVRVRGRKFDQILRSYRGLAHSWSTVNRKGEKLPQNALA